ncbi:MAG: UDP-glucose dehydrogenase family protein [Acidimicrobiales bacterium]
MKVAVFGLGYVGTVTAACLASRGHDVWGVDIDQSKTEMIAGGRSPVVEPGLDTLVAEAVAAGTLHTSTSVTEALKGAEVSLVCVGTPSAPNGGTDLRYVLRAVDDIGHALSTASSHTGFHSVVIRSTVPPGTVDDAVTPTLQARLGETGGAFGTAMCPEFLREGSGVADFFSPPFTVVGTTDDRVAEAMSELLEFLDQTVQVVGVRTAEALKYACNAFHATKVSFTNELSRLFRLQGIDSRRVMELFCDDHRLNISPNYLRPGFAFGGPCLPKDLRSLLHMARMNSVDLPLLSGTLSSNELALTDVIERVIACSGQVVALLGLSFKVSSDDLRESPNVKLAETLVGKGYEVRIHDPVVKPSQLIGTNKQYIESRLPHLQRFLADTALEALEGADLAVVSSSDAAVIGALLTTPPARVLDLSGRLGPEVEALAGYEGVGW